MLPTGVIVLAHGSRGERGKGEVEATLNRITIGLKPLLAQDVEIIGATLQFNHPSLGEAVAHFSAKGITRIVIAPYFLFPGRHITEHIPQIIRELQLKYLQTQFLLTDILGLDRAFTGLMAKRIKQSATDLIPSISSKVPHSIEQESMKILETLISFPETMKDGEAVIVKRIVHACGDTSIVPLIKFSQSAIAGGLGAIARHSPIFTDVRMVAMGINNYLAEAFGCSVSCALDEAGEVTGEIYGTRTATAISHLGARLNDAIIAIGNAPTSLMALLDLIDKEAIKPALVVGMPVGFIKASESKQELMKRDIPYITITGTRGGSPMAAATVNSLLRIAADRHLKESERC